ncbi:MAG: lytic transglycosylase domain-containing protein [Candidatus Lernaella stagnicola]|nr:lytic transglycosylase domain-containing protein [Candidatus Lernaella stagnicola]
MRIALVAGLALLLVTTWVSSAGSGVIVINDPQTVWSYTNLPPDGRERMLLEETRREAEQRAALRRPFRQKELMAIVSGAALRHGVEPELLCAIAWTESRFRPYVVSPMGAQGLLQFMPATGRKFGVRNSMNPVESAAGGARYMRYLLAEYDGNVSLALAAYNAGPGAVPKAGEIPTIAETAHFVQSVLAMRDYYRNQ